MAMCLTSEPAVIKKQTFYFDLANEFKALNLKPFCYDKHGVNSAGINFDHYKKTDLSAIREQINDIWSSLPKDQLRFVFAWSEGSLHIQLLPLKEIDGIIILGGISTNIKNIILSQAKTEEEKLQIIKELNDLSSFSRDTMMGIDRPVGRLQDEIELNENWTYFAHFTKPMLILHGDDDDEVPLTEAYAWKTKLPNNNIEIKILSNGNHMFGTNHHHGAKMIAREFSVWFKTNYLNK